MPCVAKKWRQAIIMERILCLLAKRFMVNCDLATVFRADLGQRRCGWECFVCACYIFSNKTDKHCLDVGARRRDRKKLMHIDWRERD